MIGSYYQVKGMKNMDIVVIGMIAISFWLIKLEISWCDHQIKKT